MNIYIAHEHQKKPSFFIPEDIGAPSNSFKRKKTGASDPRFKRVIEKELRNLSVSDTGKSGSKGQMTSTERQKTRNQNSKEKLFSFLQIPKDCFTAPNLKYLGNKTQKYFSNEVTKDRGFELPNSYLINENPKEFDCCHYQNKRKEEVLDFTEKTKNNYETDLKRSASDCTMQIFLKDSDSDENIRNYSSATKLLTENLIKPRKAFPEKRRSVVTIIGQTQTKPYNRLFSEIQQRRKLAKELDKHALCEALINSLEYHSDFQNVVAKVDLMLPDGKVIYSTEKVYPRKNNTFEDSLYLKNGVESLDSGDGIRRKYEMIPEKDSSTSYLGKKRNKRLTKKSVPLVGALRIKDSLRKLWRGVTPGAIWLLLVFICLVLGFTFLLVTLETPNNYIFQLFKPKTTTWYEKLLF